MVPNAWSRATPANAMPLASASGLEPACCASRTVPPRHGVRKGRCHFQRA
ncbi:MAG: hypothetical protein V1735_05625 [Nanoarchaeota archaeon]